AEGLFPMTPPLGQTVQLGKHAYVVVGVLKKAPPGGALLPDPDHSVVLPLNTCKVRFGERIVVRERGARRVEAVQLTDVVLTVSKSEQVGPTVEALRGLLEKSHPKKDWRIETEGLPVREKCPPASCATLLPRPTRPTVGDSPSPA